MQSLSKTVKMLLLPFVVCGVLTSSMVANAADAPSFTITFKNGTFEPSTLTLPKDTKVKLEIDNQEAKAIEFESHDMKAEKIIKAGKSRSLFVGPLKAGEYSFFDEFNEAAGKGKVVVE